MAAAVWQVFIRNPSRLDTDTWIELVYQPTKTLLGNLFQTWNRIGFGDASDFSRSLREGAQADPPQCLVASDLTQEEAVSLISSLESVLWSDVAIAVQDPTAADIPPSGGAQEWAVTIQGTVEDESESRSRINMACGRPDVPGGHPDPYTIIERGFQGGFIQWTRVNRRGGLMDPPLFVVAVNQTAREAKVLMKRLGVLGLDQVVLHGPGNSSVEPVTLLLEEDAVARLRTVDGEALPESGGEREYAVALHGVGALSDDFEPSLAAELAEGDPEGGHPANYNFLERGFDGGRLQYRAMTTIGASREPPMIVVAANQTLREARLLQTRLSLIDLRGSSVDLHGPGMRSMDEVTSLLAETPVPGQEGFAAQLEELLGGAAGIGEDANVSGATSKEFLASLPSLTVDAGRLEQLQQDDKTTCALCFEDLAIGDTVTEFPDCGHCFHWGVLKDGASGRECNGVQFWLAKNNSCPVCRQKFPLEGNPGDWKCAVCDQSNHRLLNNCTSCHSARNVGLCFEQHRETFERAAALVWRVRRRAPDDDLALTELMQEWDCLMESEHMARLTRASWVVRRPLQRIMECELEEQAYLPEDVGAETDADVNSRGLIQLFCKLIDSAVDPEPMLAAVRGLEPVGQSSDPERPSEAMIESLVGPAGVRLCHRVATFMAEGASEENWERAETEMGLLETNGWRVTIPVQMMRFAGVRDAALLTEGIDPRSGLVVKFILNLLLESQPDPRPDTPPPQVQEGEELQLVRTLSFGTLSRQTLESMKEEAGDEEEYRKAVRILWKLCKNLLSNRSETKFRTVDLANPRLHSECTHLLHARKLLGTAGFGPVQEDGKNLLRVTTFEEDKLMRLCHLFREELDE